MIPNFNEEKEGNYLQISNQMLTFAEILNK
jgi:hypothetical protein